MSDVGDKQRDRLLAAADLQALVSHARSLSRVSLIWIDEMAHAPLPPDTALVHLTIGTRGDMTRQAAMDAAEAWRTARKRFPNAALTISIAGYDNDPRELWEIPDVCRYVCRWACGAGIKANDPEHAGIVAVPVIDNPKQAFQRARDNFISFLAACGFFGEEIRVASTLQN